MRFEPFRDRLSRDIRNDLARSLARSLAAFDSTPVRTTAAVYLNRNIAGEYKEYVRDRLGRYETAVHRIVGGFGGDVLRQALVLWDLQLFFEVHEILEQAWRRASGDDKPILQALIRAAGVYVKLEYGYAEAARKMAGRALPVLEEHTAYIARYFPPEKLLEPLRNPSLPPPRLLEG